MGELALRGLRELDAVAYVRFASVYRKFEDVAEFERGAGAARRASRPLQHEHLFEPSCALAEGRAKPHPSEPEVRLLCYPLRPGKSLDRARPQRGSEREISESRRSS